MSIAASTPTPPRRLTSGADPMPRFAPRPVSARVLANDQVIWGVPIRAGFSELDDPSYHGGLTGHAFFAGNDHVAACGYRPPRRRFLSRRHVKLGLPSAQINPMCRECTEIVALLRRPVAVPVTPARSRVPVLVRADPAIAHAPPPRNGVR